MSDDQSTYAIVLQDDTSGPAQNASAALEQLKAKLEQDTRALRDMQGAMQKLRAAGQTGGSALRQMTRESEKLKASIAEDTAAVAKAEKEFKKVKPAVTDAGESFAKFVVAARRLPGPLGGLSAALDGVVKLVGGGGALAAGLVAIAAAAALAVVGIGALAVGLLQYAIVQSNARRAELSHLDALASVTQSNEQAARTAARVQGAVDRVTDSYALSRAEVVGLAQRLERAGVSAATFETRLNHAANVAVRRKWGGDLDDALLDLNVQGAKVQERVARLFSGLKIEGFLRGLNELTSLLSQNTASGRALKEIVETLFQPLVDAVGSLGPVARRFFQGLVIGALEVLLAVDDLRFMLRKVFGPGDVLSGIDLTNEALLAGEAVVLALAAGAAVLGVALTGAALGVAGLVKGLEYLSSFEGIFRDAGDAAVRGLVDGLRAGAATVVDAVHDLAGAARGALTDALDIHSPSRVFAELGAQIPAGLADGVRTGAPEVDAAVASVVTAPAAAGAGASRSVTIGEINIHTAATDARGLAEDLRPALEDLLEGLAVEAGREPSP